MRIQFNIFSSFFSVLEGDKKKSCAIGKHCYNFYFTTGSSKGFVYNEISLLIGSTANFAGDGPRRVDSLELNGFKIWKNSLRFYITELNENLLRAKFSNNSIQVGDEVLKLNGFYCEHLRNVTKYVETTIIHSMQLRKRITGIYYDVAQQNTNPDSTTQRKRSRRNRKYIITKNDILS